MLKKIINKLNQYFSNQIELSELCDEFSNNPDVVIKIISKIIKYAFVNKDFIDSNETLTDISDKIDGIDEKYQLYLRKTRLTLFKRKNEIDPYLKTILDADIRFADIADLMVPTKEKIEEICQLNEREKKKREKSTRCQTQRGFDIIAFTYSRKELITITPSFQYDYPTATGNIQIDFQNKYQEERYIDRPQTLHPLNKDYQTNIEDIKTHTDILLKKVGNVYEIENGKHRILYIMKHGIPVQIPVTMTRRIEDREFNEILCILKENYQAKFYKNNILNDEPNILINIQGKAYVIKNKQELLSFYKSIRDKEPLTNYQSIPFDIKPNGNIKTYENMIYQKYLEVGDIILSSNFTELSKYFGQLNNLFYQAFNMMQKMYQEAMVYQLDFIRHYQQYMKVKTSSNFDAEKWQQIMGTPHKKR